jgi:hypothetical protein
MTPEEKAAEEAKKNPPKSSGDSLAARRAMLEK